jgi:hypothetical protein
MEVAMSQNLSLVKLFEVEHKKRIEGFGLQDWIDCQCEVCKSPLSTNDLMTIEIHFEPRFLGDISFNYFCKSCCSAFSKHLKCDVKNISDIIFVLAAKDQPAEIINQNKLSSFSEHNVIKRLMKEGYFDVK